MNCESLVSELQVFGLDKYRIGTSSVSPDIRARVFETRSRFKSPC